MDIPQGKKHMFGTVKVGEKGQIVIPKEARELFSIKPGDQLMILGDEDEHGLAIIKNEVFVEIWERMARLAPGGANKKLSDILTEDNNERD
ncbi:MAG: AbrB/MazE/SpoVT family DNA-binding domain-containing protein [Eubacteriales bacterium]|nr:AbrB/MazE/SpoVT family DNA-binding domain-containing protein [Eubacteriales bacterium]MDD3880978.1 AbrB/MazE/SpoVT family DNA-binding domain-containing protein [Eubacteriales bacterium]MDD4511953.1 AbrB/MazE/SpoVT family DNA-binding domain-containing protein [Eubacteriales bacterium]